MIKNYYRCAATRCLPDVAETPHEFTQVLSAEAAGRHSKFNFHPPRYRSDCAPIIPRYDHGPKTAIAVRATTSAIRPGLEVSEFLRIYPHARFSNQRAEIPRRSLNPEP